MDNKKIRFVTANSHQLQGLRLVPIGLFLVFFGLFTSGSLDWLPLAIGVAPTSARARLLTWIGLGFWLMIALALAAPAYYRQRYGSVDPSDRRWRNRWITAVVIGYFVLIRVDKDTHWPVSLSLLLVSASLFITVWRDGRIRPHYLVAAVVWLVVSFLPAVLNVSPADTTRVASCLLGGLTLIGCGIGDHLLLTRTLATPRTTDDAPHPAAV